MKEENKVLARVEIVISNIQNLLKRLYMYTLLKWKQARRDSLLTKAECFINSGGKITL